jgi:hypothetical protein
MRYPIDPLVGDDQPTEDETYMAIVDGSLPATKPELDEALRFCAAHLPRHVENAIMDGEYARAVMLGERLRALGLEDVISAEVKADLRRRSGSYPPAVDMTALARRLLFGFQPNNAP